MKIIDINKVHGVKVIKFKPFKDKRGQFKRIFCKKFFFDNKIFGTINQINLSYNKKAGTFRGFHFQKKPKEEKKFILCQNGKIYIALLDLRKESKTYLKTFSKYFSSISNTAIYVPKGIATAFLTLSDNVTVMYLMSENYFPDKSYGVNYKDPKIKIKWPIDIKIISNKDKNFPFIQ